MLLISLCFLVIISTVVSSPVPSKREVDNNRVLYDQRQEGEWNVHADLKNFIILIIPTQTSSSTPGPSLLDFLSKAVPKRGHLKKNNVKKPGEETMHFIESKTAPYHVDISRSRNHLAKLHPEPKPTLPVINAEEIVIAKSPTVALIKEEGQHSRTARAFVLTATPTKNTKKEGKKESKKKSNPKSVLTLLGMDYEQCGPGLARDSEGICRIIKN